MSTVGRVIGRLGVDRVVPVFAPIAAAALLLIPAAAVTPALPTLITYEAIFGYCATVWTVGSMSLLQTLVASHEIGRVAALSRTVAVLAIPVGALLAGALADAWRIVPTLVLFAVVALMGTVAVVARRATYRSAPAAAAEGVGAGIGH